MQSTVSAIITLINLLFWMGLGYQVLDFVKIQAIQRIEKGLSPSEPFAQKLTGKRLDKNFNLVPLKREQK